MVLGLRSSSLCLGRRSVGLRKACALLRAPHHDLRWLLISALGAAWRRILADHLLDFFVVYCHVLAMRLVYVWM